MTKTMKNELTQLLNFNQIKNHFHYPHQKSFIFLLFLKSINFKIMINMNYQKNFVFIHHRINIKIKIKIMMKIKILMIEIRILMIKKLFKIHYFTSRYYNHHHVLHYFRFCNYQSYLNYAMMMIIYDYLIVIQSLIHCQYYDYYYFNWCYFLLSSNYNFLNNYLLLFDQLLLRLQYHNLTIFNHYYFIYFLSHYVSKT